MLLLQESNFQTKISYWTREDKITGCLEGSDDVYEFGMDDDYIDSTEAKAADMHGATYDDYDADIPSRGVTVSRRDPATLSVVSRDTGVAGYTKPGNELLGQQSAAVDGIINDTLRALPAKLAGDIRNATSRSGNKLMALQVELNKRGIKL